MWLPNTSFVLYFFFLQDPDSIVFLTDLHLTMPPNLIDNIRKVRSKFSSYVNQLLYTTYFIQSLNTLCFLFSTSLDKPY